MPLRYVSVRFSWGWAVWDRAKQRICDGIYKYEIDSSQMAEFFNSSESNNRGDRIWELNI